MLEAFHGADAPISYCYNRGNIYGTYGQIGGVGGNNYYLGDNTIHNCYNTGAVSGGSRVGSILGQAAGSSISNCWWTSANAGLGNSGSMTASAKVTEDTLKGYVNNLGTEYFTEDDIGINDGFPILKWEKERWEKENTKS